MFFATAATAMLFTSCSSDEPANQEVKDGDVFASLTLQLPEGTRSKTIVPGENTNSNDGFEIGQDRENNVGSVLVVLATKEADGSYTYVTSNLADAHPTTGAGTPARPTYNVQFETRELVSKADQKISVFAFCNPTTKLVEAAEKSFPGGFINATGNITDASISVDNGFFMSNAALTEVTLPSLDQMNNFYNKPTNPFPLGTVKVARATARFDFKETTVKGQTVANRYPIYNHANSEADKDGNVTATGAAIGYVQLDGMALMNVAKNYYYLPRVSADGKDENVTICGPETLSNYVVSPFAAQKSATPLSIDFIRTNYLYNCQPESGVSKGAIFGGLTYDALSTNLGDDNDQNWGPNNNGIAGYKIWKYATENTIPGPGVDFQRKGITTGIVFKGHIEAVEGSELATAMNGTNVIYAFNGIIYGDLAMLKKSVKANPVSTLAETFKAAFKVQEITDEALALVKDDLESTTKGGFTIYRPDAKDGKYYVYYPYYNRHNDNGNNTVMYPMEFSVVRNNIYKIAVANIMEFGHPGDPGDDPDPEDPDDPDETPKTYFRVQVQVLPWVVRINNIIL